ncbi:MAG: SMP-30/gluconolactonase/LRE family protein [Burkholderiaceae bacterium]
MTQMWMFQTPELRDCEVLSRLPARFRCLQHNDWANANKAGQPADSFLEGPCFDDQGHLYVTDIPFGRVFRIDQAFIQARFKGEASVEEGDDAWQLIAQYDGWPNGMAMHRDGSLWITDYRQGLLKLSGEQLKKHVMRTDPSLKVADPPLTGTDRSLVKPEPILLHRLSESFRGLNDLCFDRQGICYFTDQGQSGLHDPSGRVYRRFPDGRLECILQQVPSPNGIAVDDGQPALYVAVTRANQLWRSPLLEHAALSKVGAFQSFFGSSGPDGLALDEEHGIVVAHASLGAAFHLNRKGAITHVYQAPEEPASITNAAFRPGGSHDLVLTESLSGSVLMVKAARAGMPLWWET